MGVAATLLVETACGSSSEGDVVVEDSQLADIEAVADTAPTLDTQGIHAADIVDAGEVARIPRWAFIEIDGRPLRAT